MICEMCSGDRDELYVADGLAALFDESPYYDDEAYMICESCLSKLSHAIEAAWLEPREEKNEKGGQDEKEKILPLCLSDE